MCDFKGDKYKRGPGGFPVFDADGNRVFSDAYIDHVFAMDAEGAREEAGAVPVQGYGKSVPAVPVQGGGYGYFSTNVPLECFG